jgi:class 3 adenylate cyclase/tetratricopeptide (TPR) repeat protein
MSDATAAAILQQLAQKDPPVLALLWQCRTPEYLHVWKEGPELLRRFARLLIQQGHPTLALEVASRGLTERYHNDPELLYWRSLALVNCGNTTRAALFVQEMLDRNDLPPAIRRDALSLAGRIRKDVAGRTARPAARTELFRKAFAFYHQAYELSGDTFPGINAATLALLSGQPEQSRQIAAQVRDKVREELDQSGKESDYWLQATLGEASLLLADHTGARTHYSRAASLARAAHADGALVAMRRQLLLLREHLQVGDDLLGLFHLGPVVVFAGHGIDWPGDPLRFPPDDALEAAVRKAIKHELDAVGASIGYCSPGCGSDILFAELMRERDAELHVVLPFDEQDFIAERVNYGLSEMEGWLKRYREVCGVLRTTMHHATTEPFLNDQALHDFNGSFMQGLALLRAAQVGVEPVAVVVQDATPGSAPTGLTTFVANWKKTGYELRTIDLAAIRSGVKITAPPLPQHETTLRTSRRTVCSMLFADVAGFSNLPEAKLPEFFTAFLGVVEKQLETTPTLFQNTWGDGLYIVFASVVTCADFALRLLNELGKIDFRAFYAGAGPHKESGVRIGLHTGPVFKGRDPIIKQDNYFGSHVSRAARIEPVTAPGCAFVSEQFAAALALTPGHNFLCEYLGLQPLAKGYDDRCPLYRLTYRTF